MKINSLHTYSWKPLLKMAALLFHTALMHRSYVSIWSEGRQWQVASLLMRELQESKWPVLDRIQSSADSVHHFLSPPSPGSGSDKTPVTSERPRPDRGRKVRAKKFRLNLDPSWFTTDGFSLRVADYFPLIFPVSGCRSPGQDPSSQLLTAQSF